MNEEKNLNEEMNPENETGEPVPRHRRRSDNRPAEPEEAAQPTEVVEKVEEKTEEEPPREPVRQAADSRVPPEARRMAASPYHAVSPVSAAAVRHPGERPPQAVRRPVRTAAESRPAPEIRPVSGTRRPMPEGHTQQRNNARVSVGYAPGRMNPMPRTAQDYIQDLQAAREYGRDPRDNREYGREIYGREARQQENRDPRRIREYPENRYGERMPGNRPQRPAEPEKRHPLLWVVATLLVIAGFLLTAVLAMPEDSGIRKEAAEIARKITAPVQGMLEKKKEEPAGIFAFTVTGNDKASAPADVIFSVTTDRSVESLRLVDEDGLDAGAEATRVDNAENTIWSMTMRIRDGYEGMVRLQTRTGQGDWADTEYTANVQIAPALTGTETPETPSPETTASPEGKAEGTGEEGFSPADGDPAEELPEETAEEIGAAEGKPEEPAETEAGTEVYLTPEPTERPEPTPTPVPTDTPAPTPEPTPTPPLTADADPDADPSLIQTTTVYDGSKKQKEYIRPAKMVIHMPDGDDYTPAKIGVMTFRGNAFRQNAAVGEVKGADSLKVLWTAEAGSARGASQMFYGYEWTGQPAIAKWSTQVRNASNIDEEKKTKTALREVIIAGADGVIRFFDLEDGTLTRGAINLGYPMRGTPSLHPAGYPYMNVGQYTRKMKVKTGKIGLRQYNMYNQKELVLIDGLDGKMHRGLNRIGSFETSSLIDRTSDTMITLGTNGLLYLTSLNTSFDYQAGVLSINPASVVMATRAKGEKKNERVAVESSHAMYDKYVFYADMGGVLRCVDTNYLSTTWAVETGDSVYAAIALDLNEETRELALYTANMLSLRKSGGAQIRRYDALSGKEIWKTEIGVAKNTKTKEDVGVKASPVIGRQGLKDLVFFTVTGLNPDGRQALDIGETAKAALVALEKSTGTVRWAKALSDRSESSPVAVYDTAGRGWIIQCAEDGEIIAVDGLTGEETARVKLEAKIQASPAVYNDILVIGTTGKGTESVVGIRIAPAGYEEPEDEQLPGDETAEGGAEETLPDPE